MTARAAGDVLKARDCRPWSHHDRQLPWLANPPKERFFPLPMTFWQTGDAVWLAVECEHYQILQRSLRDRFPRHAGRGNDACNGSRASYLPPRESLRQGHLSGIDRGPGPGLSGSETDRSGGGADRELAVSGAAADFVAAAGLKSPPTNI